jgi:hypothetical protein
MILSLALLLLSAGLLVGGLFAVQAGAGLRQFWGWPAILILGLIFVHSQVLAVTLVLSIMVADDTSKPCESSNIEEEVE